MNGFVFVGVMLHFTESRQKPGWGDSSVGKVLEGPSSVLRKGVREPSLEACAYSPSTGEVEPGRSSGPAGQPA